MIIGLHIYESEALLMENAEWGFISYGKFAYKNEEISVSFLFILHSYKNEVDFHRYYIFISFEAKLIVNYSK